jgi:hypothetical protein
VLLAYEKRRMWLGTSIEVVDAKPFPIVGDFGLCRNNGRGEMLDGWGQEESAFRWFETRLRFEKQHTPHTHERN